jgi:carbon-monoxide dehydrogenase medium subunit
VKASRFDYHLATGVTQAIELLGDYGADAKVLAGGQSLVPLLNFRLSAPVALVDINEVTELRTHELREDELYVGAGCRHRDIELNEVVAKRCPVIADAIGQIGHVAIRNRGTVVGSVAHADPAAEWPGLAILLDAELTAQETREERTIDAAAFFEGFLSTTLGPTELLTAVRFPLPSATSGSAWVEFTRRSGDFAIVGVGAVVDRPEGVITDARIVVSGVSATPVRVPYAEEALVGEQATGVMFADAARLAASEVRPVSDIHGDAAYRQRLTAVLTRRALTAAERRAA